MRFSLLRSLIEQKPRVMARHRDDSVVCARIATAIDLQRLKTILTMLTAGRPKMAYRLSAGLRKAQYRVIAAAFIGIARILPASPAIAAGIGSLIGGYGRWRPRKPVTLPADQALANLRRRLAVNPSEI
jgi:hypothetical protein